MAGRHATARTAALAFAGIYAVVTVIGLADGHDVLGLLPVNAADNVLHAVLAIGGVLAALSSRGDRDDDRGAVVRETRVEEPHAKTRV